MKKNIFIIDKEKVFDSNQLPFAMKKAEIYFYSSIEAALKELLTRKPDAIIISANAVGEFELNQLIRCEHPLMSSKSVLPIYILWGGILIYPKAQEMYKDGEEIIFTPKEREIMWLLLKNRNEIVTYKVFYSEIWGEGQSMDANSLRDYKDRLAVHISSIRKKLNLHKGSISISCVNERGYKLKDKARK